MEMNAAGGFDWQDVFPGGTLMEVDHGDGKSPHSTGQPSMQLGPPKRRPIFIHTLY